MIDMHVFKKIWQSFVTINILCDEVDNNTYFMINQNNDNEKMCRQFSISNKNLNKEDSLISYRAAQSIPPNENKNLE